MRKMIALLPLAALALAAADAPAPERLKSAAARALKPLREQSPNFIRIGGCNSCHNQDLPVAAQSLARERGVDAGEDIALAPDTDGFERVFEHSGNLGAGNTGYGAMSHIARKLPLDAKTDAVAAYLMARQEPDGRWDSPSNRQPLTHGDHLATALGIYVLKAFARPARRAEIEARVARATAWLQEHPPVSNQDAAMQVMGLVWGSADKEAIARAAAQLRSRQRADGGWSQLPSLAPDAYATGQALYALALAGGTKDEAYRRGLDFLLRTQAAGGAWHVKARSKPVQPYFESGFPYGHDQWISAAGTSWAVMALSMAIEAPAASASR
jgi:hypothetical protein